MLKFVTPGTIANCQHAESSVTYMSIHKYHALPPRDSSYKCGLSLGTTQSHCLIKRNANNEFTSNMVKNLLVNKNTSLYLYLFTIKEGIDS